MVDYNDWAGQAKRTSSITADQNKKNAASRQASSQKTQKATSSFFTDPLGTLFGWNKNSGNNAASASTDASSGTRSSTGGSFGGGNSQTLSDHPDLIKTYVGQGEAAPTAAPQQTFADFMAQAAKYLGSGSAVDTSQFDNQAATVRQNGGLADAKLKAMYDQLKSDFAADGTKLNANYDAAGKAITNDSDQGTAAVKQGYKASTDALTAQLKNLGIEDALKVAVNNGTTLQGDQAATLGNISTNKAANLNNNTSKKAAAGQYNVDIQEAAGSEGAAQRAANQQALQAALTDIANSKRAAVSSSAPSGSAVASLAQQLYQNYQDNNPESVANILKSQQVANDAANATASAQTAASKLTSQQQQNNTATMLRLLQQAQTNFPGDQNQQNQWVAQQAKVLGIG